MGSPCFDALSGANLCDTTNDNGLLVDSVSGEPIDQTTLSDANDPGLNGQGAGFGLGNLFSDSTPTDPNDPCPHWYSHLTSINCLGNDIGGGVGSLIDKATKPLVTEVNFLLIVIVLAIVVVVGLILFGKNTGVLASHLRIG